MTKMKIDYLGSKGDGVAVIDKQEVFVPFTLAEETVTVEGSGNRRRLVSVEEPSPLRVDPKCEHFGICGGCQVQHLENSAYEAWKMQLVSGPLTRAGIDVPLEPMLSFSDASRRKCVFSAVQSDQGIVMGFAAKASHDVVNVNYCAVSIDAINGRLDDLRDIASSATLGKVPVRLAVLDTANGLDVAFEEVRSLSEDQRQVLIRKAIQYKLARLTVNQEVLVEVGKPEIQIADVTVVPPPASFVQAVKAAEDAMSDLVATHLSSCKTVADLYCGIGTFALRLARKSVVFAYEESGDAIKALDHAWRTTGGKLKQIKTEIRNLERRPMSFMELKRIDGLVFDPPRSGAELQARQIAKSKVKRVAAVSCNPVTLARDLSILEEGGFRITKIFPIDQFKHTPHVEVVALLER